MLTYLRLWLLPVPMQPPKCLPSDFPSMRNRHSMPSYPRRLAAISQGPSEVMSTHVDSVTVAKRSGDNRVEVQIFHVQVGVSVGFLFFQAKA